MKGWAQVKDPKDPTDSLLQPVHCGLCPDPELTPAFHLQRSHSELREQLRPWVLGNLHLPELRLSPLENSYLGASEEF